MISTKDPTIRGPYARNERKNQRLSPLWRYRPLSRYLDACAIVIMIDPITALSRLSHRLRGLSTTPIRIKYYMY